MIELNDESLAEFQELYKKHTGIELSRDEALAKSIRLIRTIELIYKPMTEEEFENLLKKDIF